MMDNEVGYVVHDQGVFLMEQAYMGAMRGRSFTHHLSMDDRIDDCIALEALLEALHLAPISTLATWNHDGGACSVLTATCDMSPGTTPEDSRASWADPAPLRTEVLARVDVTGHHIEMSACAASRELIDRLKTRWQEIVDERSLQPEEENQVRLEMTFLTPQGVSSRAKMIEAPAWAEIRDNYPNAASMDRLIALERPWEAGKIFLWHGPPGTGKTFAVRALMRAWGEKARIIYPMDPERVFGDSSYLFSLMTEAEDIDGPPRSPRRRRKWPFMSGKEIPQTGGGVEAPACLLLLLEDALDILLEENRATLGPSMARLLNLSEGILGQGLNVVLGFTTNHSLARIDPAFLRPGRCLQALEFPLLDHSQALAFFLRHHRQAPQAIHDDKGRRWSLADLYARDINEHVEGPLILGGEKAINGFTA